MEQRTKQDIALINLVSEFEVSSQNGKMKYLDVKAFGQLIEYYESEGALDKAIGVAKLALKQYKYRAEFYIVIAELYLNNGKVKKSLTYLEKAETIAPYESEIILLKAKALTQYGKYDEAFNCLEEASILSTTQDQVDIHICEANIYYAMRSFGQMYQALKLALELDPANEAALEKMLSATELSRNFIQSIDLHRTLIDKQPYNYLAWYNLGHALSYEGEYEDAIDALEYSFIINADFEEGYMDCADLCIQVKNYDRALGIYEDAIDVFGSDSDLLTNIAECQLRLGKINESKYNLYKAVRLEQNSDEIYFLLGECYAQQKEWYRSINAYHKAIEIEDGSEDYYLGLARAYIAVEEYNKATINFQLAVNIGPEQSVYWKEYSSFLIKMGLYDEALQVLDEAEDFTFGSDLLYVRALVNFFKKDRKEGMNLLEDALLEDFNMHKILFEMAPELEVDAEISSMINYFAGE